MIPPPYYESDEALAQYLLFHYGTPEQICPLMPEPRAACDFPLRCVTETLPHVTLVTQKRALDLGCAVGRSSIELAHHFDEVVGIDFSHRFVEASVRMAREREVTVRVPREGAATDDLALRITDQPPRGQLHFEQGDACALRPDLGTFDLVLMANLIDRLPDPQACLARLPSLVVPQGWIVLTSPYTWLEEYTPRAKWLGTDTQSTLEGLRANLEPNFVLRHTLDLPFLIRDHRRKYQWSVAEASLWQRAG